MLTGASLISSAKLSKDQPFCVQKISDKTSPLIVEFISNCLRDDPRWVYLVPENSKRAKVCNGKLVF